MNASNNTAVITGAASGMGRAFAQRFAADGMNVVLADIEEPPLRELQAELEAAGTQVVALRTDVSSLEDNRALAVAAHEAFGGVDVLCLNAGVAPMGSFLENTPNDWVWGLGVNLFGIAYGLDAFLADMMERDCGHIVITASIAGHTASPRLGIYNATKHGAVAIAESLHNELAGLESNVAVTCLCPGLVNTDILNSDRNRPEQLLDRDLEGNNEREMTWEMIAEVFDDAKPPSEVADQVAQAVADKQFWLFTDHDFDEVIAKRHQQIRDRVNPHAERLIEIDD